MATASVIPSQQRGVFMKSLVMIMSVFGIVSAEGGLALAEDFEVRKEVVHDVTRTVRVALNDKTVLCSRADYGAEFLKILIPDLAGLTLLDHRNEGAGAPCVGAGQCGGPGRGGPVPGDILDPARPSARVGIRIRLIRENEIDHRAKTCAVNLIEEIDTGIRGVDFFHRRVKSLGTRHYEDCL